MDYILFESTRRFTIWDFSSTHRRLLLRSLGLKVRGKTIDILFTSVTNLQMNCDFNGIKLYITEEDMSKFEKLDDTRKFESKKKFILESNEEKHSVTASIVKIFENDFLFHEGLKDNDHEGNTLISQYPVHS